MPFKETVLRQVRASFEHERRINLHRYPISMEFQDGDLTLEGEMADVRAKKMALELAASVPGVVGIVDRLRVAPAQPMGDGAIRDHARDALLVEPIFDRCTIAVWDKGRLETCRTPAEDALGVVEIAVEYGVVTLNGKLSSLSHKRLAGVLAWWVPGSRDVVNGMEVSPPQEDNDDEVCDAVRLVLEKDPFVDAGQIRVSARNAVVTLVGVVATPGERDMAANDAWYVFGVDAVQTNLEVRS